MEIFHDIDKFKNDGPSALSLGKFDGVHRGHELLIDELVDKKKKGFAACVFTFDIPPKKLTSDTDYKLINTNSEKMSVFEDKGVDKVLICPFTESVMKLNPTEFITLLVHNLNVKYIVVGEDFAFGYKRAGNVALLDSLQSELGYKLIVKKKLMDKNEEISSTLIREKITLGDMDRASELLGYDYFVDGIVTKGNRIGHTISFPTINIPVKDEKLAPPYGVYAAKVKIGDNIYKGIANIGVKPTIEASGGKANPLAVEMNIFDFDEEIYNASVRVYLAHFVRPEKHFSNIFDLQDQIKQDIVTVSKFEF